MAPLPGQHVIVVVSPGFFTPTSEAATMQSEILDIAARSNTIIDTMKPRVHHSLKVRVSERGLSVQAREGYSAPAPEKHKHEIRWRIIRR